MEVFRQFIFLPFEVENCAYERKIEINKELGRIQPGLYTSKSTAALGLNLLYAVDYDGPGRRAAKTAQRSLKTYKIYGIVLLLP